jgi:hypothetical protein
VSAIGAAVPPAEYLADSALAANVLVALGLVTYTEVLSRLVLWNPTDRSDRRRAPKDGRIPFYTFLDRPDGGWYR